MGGVSGGIGSAAGRAAQGPMQQGGFGGQQGGFGGQQGGFGGQQGGFFGGGQQRGDIGTNPPVPPFQNPYGPTIYNPYSPADQRQFGFQTPFQQQQQQPYQPPEPDISYAGGSKDFYRGGFGAGSAVMPPPESVAEEFNPAQQGQKLQAMYQNFLQKPQKSEAELQAMADANGRAQAERFARMSPQQMAELQRSAYDDSGMGRGQQQQPRGMTMDMPQRYGQQLQLPQFQQTQRPLGYDEIGVGTGGRPAPAMTQEQLRNNIQQAGLSPSQGYGGLGAAGQQQINQLLQDAKQRSQQGPDAGMQAAYAGFQRDQAAGARNGPIDPARLAQIHANVANQGPAGQFGYGGAPQMNQQQQQMLRDRVGQLQQQPRGMTMDMPQRYGRQPAPPPNQYQMYGGLGGLFNMQNAFTQQPRQSTQTQINAANQQLLQRGKTIYQTPAKNTPAAKKTPAPVDDGSTYYQSVG